MVVFDVSKDWALLLPGDIGAVPRSVDDLRHIISLLRIQAGIALPPPRIMDGSLEAPDASTPLMVLNAGNGGDAQNGFSWRLGLDRLELFGASKRGLCNGVYDFLNALGVGWLRPDREILPRPAGPPPGGYTVFRTSAYQPSEGEPAKWRRLVISRETSLRDRDMALLWAARNGVDAIVLPFYEQAPNIKKLFQRRGDFQERALSRLDPHGFIIEAGGWDLSLLLPRRYFFARRELFRMEAGKRVKSCHFCPTHPDSQRIFRAVIQSFLQRYPKIPVIHLWPERNQEKRWCSCPTCRAFSPEEQNRIAVNAAADIIAQLRPEMRVCYYENSDAPLTIAPRSNAFSIKLLPGQPGAENLGLYLAEDWRRDPR